MDAKTAPNSPGESRGQLASRRQVIAGLAAFSVGGPVSGDAGSGSHAPDIRTFATISALRASNTPPRGPGTHYRVGTFVLVETRTGSHYDFRTAGGARLQLVNATDRFPLEGFGAASGAWDASPARLPDAADALEAAVRRLAVEGGGTIEFTAGRSYRIDRPVTIRTPNVQLQGNGARLVGNGRIVVEGAGPGGAGDGMVPGFAMRGFLMSGQFRGPLLRFCRGYELADLARDNTAGTWINVLFCRDGAIRDCVARNGERTKIAFLVLGGENNVGERCRVTGGEWVYAFQLKGGRNNWFRDCSIENVTRMTHGFRIRGDAPWHPSRTQERYPFLDGSWSRPDARRATRESGFVRCTVRNSAGVHFLATEFVDCAFEDCRSLADANGARPTIGLFAFRPAGGGERGLRVTRFTSTGASSSGIVVRGANPRERLAGIVLEDVAVTGAGKHGIDCDNCDAPIITRPVVTDCKGAGIALHDSPGYQLTTPRISGCRQDLQVT